MKAILIFLALLIPLSLANPSDLIHIEPKPQTVALSGTSADSLAAVAALNGNLTKFDERELTDIGHYYSGIRASGQDLETISPVQLSFVNSTPELPSDIGNATNATLVTNDTSGLTWIV
jgi:hypothetical protein